MINFEEKIKVQLTKKKMSIESLAAQIGVSKNTILNIFKKNEVNSKHLEKMAEVLDVSLLYFFGESNGNYQNNHGSKNQNLQGNVNGNVTINNGHKLTDIEKDAEIIKLNERIDLLIEKIVDREKQLEDKQKLLDQVIEGKDKQIARIIEEKEKQIELYKKMIEMLEKQMK